MMLDAPQSEALGSLEAAPARKLYSSSATASELGFGPLTEAASRLGFGLLLQALLSSVLSLMLLPGLRLTASLTSLQASSVAFWHCVVSERQK